MSGGEKVEPINTNTMTTEQALDYAKRFDMKEVMIFGFGEDDVFSHIHTSMNKKDALWLLFHEACQLIGAIPDDD